MKRIAIENIKNIRSLIFEIPNPGLHVITGKNGSGKTTLFTCLNRICNGNAYRIGFATSEMERLDVFSGSVTYSNENNEVRYTRRENGEWRPNSRKSHVLEEFGYPQVINITTKDVRLFTQERVIPRNFLDCDTWLNEKLNYIFDTEKFTSMIRITTGDLRGRRSREAINRRRNVAYAIPIGEGYYTERNFSFGEIILINLLYDIKRASNGALILIDELELALHPSAQIRLISVLRNLACKKGLTILISTHSSSIIKFQREVIFLDRLEDGTVKVIYDCPPAKAIGAIGMREDTNPDIVILVEDRMAKSFFYALMQQYLLMQNSSNYLDVRILELGPADNVIHFFIESEQYIFYDNVYVAAFMDKDVETDLIQYPLYANPDLTRKYNEHSAYLHFLPYTPEVFLVKTLYEKRQGLLQKFREQYNNQQIQYSCIKIFDFDSYFSDFPNFNTKAEYNSFIKCRGEFRSKCKEESKRIVENIAREVNQSVEEIYRFVFKFAVEEAERIGDINVRALLASTMKRIRR